MKEQEDLRNLKETASRIVDLATKKGAATVAVSLQQKTEFQVEVRNREIENLLEAQFHDISITISKDGRRSSVASCDFGMESIESLVERALAMCRYTDPDPFYSLPEAELLATQFPDLDVFDPGMVALEPRDKIDMVLDLEARTLAVDPRLKADGTSVSTMYGASAQANSLGFNQGYLSSLIVLETSCFAEDEVAEGDLNKGRKQTGGWSTRARYREDLKPVDVVAGCAASRVLRKLGARKPRTGKFPVYFEPAMARTLWRNLLSAISGSNIYRHESYLVDRMKTPVCAANITLRDEPLLRRGLASHVYDSEGVGCQPRALVDQGLLSTYMLSTYSANKLGMRSTGHAGGGGNMLIEPGELSESDMIRKMGTGVWLTSLFGQGVNMSTGDFSRGAFGLWVENGEVQYPIMEFTLNSNLDRMFKGIALLGADVEPGYSILTPGFVIDEMSLSGN